MRQFGNALAYHVPQRSQVRGPILGGQLVSAHSRTEQNRTLYFDREVSVHTHA